MTELVVLQGDHEQRLLFELDPDPTGAGGRGRDSEVGIKDWFTDRFHSEENPKAIADIGETIQQVARSAAEGFSGMATDRAGGGNFSEAELTFGLKISAEGNAFVSKAGVEAHVSVTFKWDFS
jgi:hypothetical protein